jgi:hypothetical protein
MDKPEVVTVAFELDKDVHKLAKMKALELDLSLRDFLAKLVKEAFGK